MMVKAKPNEQSAEFLIAEFNAIQERVVTLEHVKSNRINFFIILTSAIIAGGASLYEPVSKNVYFPFIILGITFLLTIIGVVTLDYSLADSITIVNFLRVAGRVRRYFVDRDVELGSYVAFDPNDDRPLFRAKGFSFRGSERILLILNSLSFSVCITTAIIALPLYLPWFNYVIIAAVSTPVFWTVQYLYIKRKLFEAEKMSSERVRFKS